MAHKSTLSCLSSFLFPAWHKHYSIFSLSSGVFCCPKQKAFQTNNQDLFFFFWMWPFIFVSLLTPMIGKIYCFLTQALQPILLPDCNLSSLLLALFFECDDFTVLISVQLPLICTWETENWVNFLKPGKSKDFPTVFTMQLHPQTN